MTRPAQLPPFARVLEIAREISGLSPAELDHGLAFPDPGGPAPHDAVDAYASAIYRLVEHPDGDDAAVDELVPAAREIREQYRPQLDAHIAAARDRGFTGWSSAARARGERIRYAGDDA